MFGCTLICQKVKRLDSRLEFEFRQASSDRLWYITLPSDDPMIEHLSPPGACFALVRLATVGQAESRGRF
jgi:hypothetical protein